ncbi:extracellular solute-binding protein [Pleionea sp. CnH1-48]|uniref:extracellular solute-binding protein n=1 Tax=Pleionea sp. CnH1-48 TaxID=2954494 RepID=UPI002096D98C|nr:extracellular solute-binding protein [Pleionea sp. CnH1-48]MCO7224044.1 extracellular solute-binding protein [Pleionea sp. CnH1-48]
MTSINPHFFRWSKIGNAFLLMLTSIVSMALHSSQESQLSNKTSSSKPTEIVWSFWGDPWEIEVNHRVIKLFESENPDITVHAKYEHWSSYFSSVDNWFASSTPPDVLFLSHIEKYVQRGDIQSLEPYIAKAPIDVNDFYPALLDQFKSNGQIYGFPRDNDTKVIFYNKTHFDKAQLPYPDCQWTWDQFRTVAEKLTNEKQQFGVAYLKDWIDLLFWQNGGYKYHTQTYPDIALLDSNEGIESLTWFTQLIEQYSPVRNLNLSSYDAAKLFMEEKVSMVFGNHALVPFLSRQKHLDWDVVCLPSKKLRVNKIGGAGYVISHKSKQKDAAWRFIKWLVSIQGQAIFTESGAIVPSRISVSESPVFQTLRSPRHARVFIEETRHGKPELAYPEKSKIRRVINQKINQVILGELSLENAINEAKEEINVITR